MRIPKILVLSLLLITDILFSQEVKSIFQLDYEQYGIKNKEKSEFDISGKDIIPLIEQYKGMKKSVYGYLPDWEYQTTRNYLNYDLLTHISAFDFVVDFNGNVGNPSYWPWTDVINAAHLKGVKIIMTAVCFKPDTIHNLLTNSVAKQNFFNSVLSKINTYKLDGVNIDFESIPSADRGSLLNSFMLQLTNFVHQNAPGKEVSFAGPAVNWGGWDLLGLANSCDYIFIMGYDFYGSWSSTTGPSAPLVGGTYNITNTVNVQYAAVTNSNPSKLILGVPYYGNKWKTQNLNPGSQVISHIGSTRFKDDIVNSQSYGLLYNSYQTVWYRYILDGENYQVWFENDSSLGLKYDLANSKNFRGVGMWALGYDNTRQELWNLLRNKFFIKGTVELISPNGGEVLNAFSNFDIRWNSTYSNRIKIEYSINNGTNWYQVIDSYPSDSMKYTWTVPNYGSDSCLIKITDLNSDNTFDVSNSVFRMIGKKPSTPILLSPVNYQKNLPKAFSLMWSNAEGASKYNLQIAFDSLFTSLFLNDSTISQTLKYIADFSDGKKYYWRVRALNDYGSSEYSTHFSFITRIIEPDSLKAENLSENKVRLSWINRSQSNDGYIVQRKREGESDFSVIDTIGNELTYIDSTISGNVLYFYRVYSYNSYIISSPSKEVVITTLPSDVSDINNEYTFVLYQNYPNPFNPSTTIRFKIPSQKIKLTDRDDRYGNTNFVVLSIIDILGRHIETIVEKVLVAGEYSIMWNANNLPAGIYFYELKFGELREIKKMILIK